MRILAIVITLCTLLSAGCTSEKSDYDAGIAAYERGHYEAALYDFESRAMRGDPVAQFCLGFMYKHGISMDKRPKKAEDWYTKAAEQDYAPAQNNLAVMYAQRAQDARNRLVTDADTAKVAEEARSYSNTAAQWFQKAAVKRNNPIAQYNLAIIWYYQAVMFDQLAMEKNKFLEYLPEDSEDSEVQKFLEMIKNSPSSAVEAYEEAVNWFKKAAENHFTRAQYELANRYYYNEGVDKNLTVAERWKKAEDWYTEAAEAKYAPAQNALHRMYAEGKGVDKNLTVPERWKKAKDWYTKAAENGDADVQFALGRMYYNGEGVEKNLSKAIKWYTKAAKQRNASAQNNLAIMYAEGKGVPKNPERAARLYFYAAQQDYRVAQANIGLNFENGMNGVPQDNEEAYYWYSLALRDPANLDKPATTENLAATVTERHEGLGNKLTEKKKNEIQEQVDNWKQKSSYGFGTGFYINKNHILTNSHVVDSYNEFRIPYRRVKLIAKDDEVDLALLFDERGNTDTFATFRSDSVDVGEDIASFGYPLSDLLSYRGNGTSGIVSGLSGTITGSRPDNHFQHTAPIQGGNSGGPVFDLTGNVVGVTKYRIHTLVKIKQDGTPQTIKIDPPQNANFAIKFNVIEDFLRENEIDYTLTENLDSPITRGAIDEEDQRKAIYENARKFTVPVVCFKHKGPDPLPLKEISIEELK